MFIMGGGGGGIGAETVSLGLVTSVTSSRSFSVCVSMDLSSGALGKSIGSTSITVALSTNFFSLRFGVFFGDDSN